MNKYIKIFIFLLLFSFITISFASNNPYSDKFDSTTNSKLEAIITKLELQNIKKSSGDFVLLLNTLSSQLKALQSYYPNNDKLNNFVSYFNYEIDRMIFDSILNNFSLSIDDNSNSVSTDNITYNTNTDNEDENEEEENNSGDGNTTSNNNYSINTPNNYNTTTNITNTSNNSNTNSSTSSGDDFTTAFSMPGYNLTLSGYSKDSNGKYIVGNYIPFEKINISTPSGVKPESCIIRTNNKKSKTVTEILKYKDGGYYIPINIASKTIDLMCGFAGGSSNDKPHVEIRRIGCSTEDIAKLDEALNSESVYGTTKCNIVHKRIFVTYDSTLPNYNEYYLDSKGYEMPDISLSIDKTNLEYMEKAHLSWNLGGDIDYCTIKSYAPNGDVDYIIGKLYNKTGYKSDNDIKIINSGGFDFYGTKSGKIKITCYKSYEMKPGQIVKLDKSDIVNITVSGEEEDLISLEAEHISGDHVKVTWNIDSKIDLDTCTSGGFNFGNRASGSVTVAGEWIYNFGINCDDPSTTSTSYVKNRITATKQIRLEQDNIKKHVTLTASDNDINNGESVTLTRSIYGYSGTCYLQDLNLQNSLNGKKQITMSGESSQGTVQATPNSTTVYKLMCGNNASGAVSNRKITVDGGEFNGTIITNQDTSITSDNSNDVDDQTNTGTQMRGKCTSFNINHYYDRSESKIKSEACKTGEIKDGTFEKTVYSTYKKYTWKCEGLNGGSDSYECKIKAKIDSAKCGSHDSVKFTNSSVAYGNGAKDYLNSSSMCEDGNVVTGSIKYEYGRYGRITWECATDDATKTCGLRIRDLEEPFTID